MVCSDHRARRSYRAVELRLGDLAGRGAFRVVISVDLQLR
jgi:hypothetical protein